MNDIKYQIDVTFVKNTLLRRTSESEITVILQENTEGQPLIEEYLNN